MYITTVNTKTKKGKISHECILLRESYREDGKVKNRTLANLTHRKPEEVEAIRLALKHKKDLSVLGNKTSDIKLKEGQSVGAVWLIYEAAKKLGIEKALGTSRQGKLALWLVISRLINQGSRLSAVRLAKFHAACDVLKMEKGFCEDDLYANLSWLSDKQKDIEKRLFNFRYKNKSPNLFLYDVTSSYFEGDKNELANWGYNRDKKSGKKQVVMGLLCDDAGDPVSVELFEGNTNDFKTFENQVQKIASDFGCKNVTLTGDRGMIKKAQIESLNENFHYITAITKSQIEKLIAEGRFQMELFEEEVCEVDHDNVRYILRKNPTRAKQLEQTRKEKKEYLEKFIEFQNTYLSEHPRAKIETAIKKINDKISKLKVGTWLNIEVQERILSLVEDEKKRFQDSKFDGCYVLKTDLKQDVDKQVIHDRYKDLAKVETAFKTMKTGYLEMRPWYVRLEKNTRGHALVVMLAYLISRYLSEKWKKLDSTVEEGIIQLSTLCSMDICVKGKSTAHHIPTPRDLSAKFLKSAEVKLPKLLPHTNAVVVSRKSLKS